MASDVQRHAVAENLRHLDDEACALVDEWMHRFTNDELARNAMLNIGLCMAMYEAGLETKTMGDFWDLLADLIDPPTCRNVSGCCGVFECSECGYRVDMVAEAWDGSDEPLYVTLAPSRCPNCGAKVTEKEEDDG